MPDIHPCIDVSYFIGSYYS